MAFILQQIFVGCAWGWVLWALWGEVRALMEEGRKNHARHEA